MFLTGKPLRVRRTACSRATGAWSGFTARPRWCGRTTAGRGSSTASAFDITDLKRTEAALEEERNLVSAILDTVGALVVVLRPGRAHRALQPGLRGARAGTGSSEVRGPVPVGPADAGGRGAVPSGSMRLRCAAGRRRRGHRDRLGSRARRAPADRVVNHGAADAAPARHVVATGIDITEREADGEGRARDQRAGAAADRPGPARRAGPAPDGDRLHEQGARAEAGRASGRPRPPMPARSCSW